MKELSWFRCLRIALHCYDTRGKIFSGGPEITKKQIVYSIANAIEQSFEAGRRFERELTTFDKES